MKVTLYTTSACPFCQQEKTYLQSKGLSFEEKNVELNKAYLDEMLQVGNNFAGVPITKIEKDDGQTVVLKGFTQSEFDAALAAPQPAVQAQSDDTAQPPAPTPEPTAPSVPPPSEPVVPTPAPIQPEPVQPPVAEPPQTPTQQPPAPSDPLNSILKDLQNRMSADQNQPTQPSPTPQEPTQPVESPTPQTPQPTVPPLNEPTPTTPAGDQPPAGIPSIPDFPAK